jgi:hypothetical protein
VIGPTDELNDRTPIQRNRHADLNKAKSSEKDRSAFRLEIRRTTHALRLSRLPRISSLSYIVDSPLVDLADVLKTAEASAVDMTNTLLVFLAARFSLDLMLLAQ